MYDSQKLYDHHIICTFTNNHIAFAHLGAKTWTHFLTTHITLYLTAQRRGCRGDNPPLYGSLPLRVSCVVSIMSTNYRFICRERKQQIFSYTQIIFQYTWKVTANNVVHNYSCQKVSLFIYIHSMC